MKKTNNFGKYNAARNAIVAYKAGVTYRKASVYKILKQLNKGK